MRYNADEDLEKLSLSLGCHIETVCRAFVIDQRTILTIMMVKKRADCLCLQSSSGLESQLIFPRLSSGFVVGKYLLKTDI